MKKSIVTLAVFIFIIPWLGLFEDWKKILISLCGILILVLVLAPRKEKLIAEKKKDSVSFVENNPANKEKEMSKAINEEISK